MPRLLRKHNISTCTKDQEVQPRWRLVCPHCRCDLAREDDACACRRCGKKYPVQDGVICFAESDSFYEKRYDAASVRFVPDDHSHLDLLLLYMLSQHYFWYIRKYFSDPGSVLDVACGAGARYLATRHAVAGLDLSFRSVRHTTTIYDCSVQASALSMPFSDASFDYLASKFLLEHIPLKEKMLLLAEFRRVLKPGGRMVSIMGCDCENPLFRWAKKDPELFHRHFIEHDSHHGLLLASRNLQLIRDSGFRILAYGACNRTPLLHLPMLEWLLPYAHKSWITRVVLPIVPFVSGKKWLNWAYTAGVTLSDDIVGRFFPLDYAPILLVACEKNTD